MPESRQPRPVTAFIAAAMVLLVLPILLLLGLGVLGVASGYFSGTERPVDLTSSWPALSLFIVWVVLVVAVVLTFAFRLASRLTRP